MVVSPRMRTLVDAAIGALDEGQSPFDRAFLVTYDVTYDELLSLADAIALGLRLYRQLLDELGNGPVAAKQVAGERLARAIGQ